MSFDFHDLDAKGVWENVYGKPNNKTDITPGLQAKEEGLKMQHPVVFIPGFTSVGLEIWEGEPCLKHYFRQRVSVHEFLNLNITNYQLVRCVFSVAAAAVCAHMLCTT
jgi:hypothetical protein